MSLLTIENLAVSIGGTPILKGIDLAVNAGEVLGIIGESGSGKSMTALATLQLLPEAARATGAIRFEGTDLMTLDDRAMRAIRGGRIGMVFQEPMTALNPVKTIGDQVAETARLHGGLSHKAALAVARQTLDRVELPAPRFGLGLYPHELSGGQRQRVVIAMAIAMRPKLLIADEPTTALDVTTQAQILKLLERLVREDGMGMLFISHDLGVVAGLADRVAIMRAGEVVEQGPTLGLFRALQHPYSQALLSASSHQPQRHPTPPPDAEPVLAIEGAVRTYPLPRSGFWGKPRHFTAVKGVSLMVRRGENIGLVGESGCGKSTLARAIMALDPLEGGRISIAGKPLSKKGADFATRRNLQVVFQDPYGSFNPRHRVDRLVGEPFHLLGSAAPEGPERTRRIGKALSEVGLTPADAEKYIHEFSGGQRQRIAIARALILEPSLIILDEAVSALDVSIRAQILDLLADLSIRLGVSYLFISHDLSVVRAITDRVLVMKAGEIVEEGETERVFTAPNHPYTRELLAATPNVEAALKAREARP
jgi:peptide/nickel transport system ATP-binding protein